MNCPSCQQAMIAEQFDRRPHGAVTLDICYPCNAIWFDHMESTQLAPGGVIELFKKIHAHKREGHRPFADRLACVHCRQPLGLVQDLQRTGRFTYHRCPEGHGRLTSFYQFLREKQFVRNLTEGEIRTLKAEVRQLRCSGCGGPVDLVKDTACPYCRAPISILDGAAVERTLHELHAKAQARQPIDPALYAEAMLAEHRSRAKLPRAQSAAGGFGGGFAGGAPGESIDLVVECISLVVNLWD